MGSESLKVDIEYQWGPKHSKILKAFLKKLNENDIRYFILRNYEGLPEYNDSKDVDLIVQPGHYNKAAELLLSTFKEHNLKNYYIVKYEKVRCWIGIDLEKKFSIHIDLIEGYINKGFEIFDFFELYNNTNSYNNFPVLNDAYNAVMLLLYKVIGCQELNNKYRNIIRKIYSKNSKEINLILLKVLNLKYGGIVVKYLENEDYQSIVNNAGTISKHSKIFALKSRPILTCINFSNFLLEKFYRIIWCPNKYRKTIAVLAPDGTGKTTFINGLSKILAQTFVTDIDKIHIYHFRPSILPNIGAICEKTGLMKQDKNFTNPHRNIPSNQIISFLRMTYYWIDYLIGGIICIRKDVQFDKFTIFDRYIYDFIVDPLRSRINLPRFIRCTFAKLVHQPNIVFILTTNASTIFERKQELTLEEIERQLIEFNHLAESNVRFIKLDSSKNPEEIIMEAVQILINKYTVKI